MRRHRLPSQRLEPDRPRGEAVSARAQAAFPRGLAGHGLPRLLRDGPLRAHPAAECLLRAGQGQRRSAAGRRGVGGHLCRGVALLRPGHRHPLSQSQRDPVLQATAAGGPRSQREDRPDPHPRLHRGRRLPGARAGPGPRRLRARGRGGQTLGLARPRRGGFPHRRQMGAARQAQGPRREGPGVQRRRGRSRRVHGPQRPRRQPAQHHRGDAHRRLRHRRHARAIVYVRNEYPIAIKHLDDRAPPGARARPARPGHPGRGLQLRHRGGPRARAPSCAARKPRSSAPSRARWASPGSGRHIPSQRGIEGGRPPSTTSKPGPTSPSSSAWAPRPSPRWEPRATPAPRSSAWWARSGTPAWSRCRWACTIARDRRRHRRRPGQQGQDQGGTDRRAVGWLHPRRRASTCPSTTTAWPRPARSWVRAA